MQSQIIALIIFIAMFVLIVLDRFPKHKVTLSCGLLTLFLVFVVSMESIDAIIETLNYEDIFTLGFWYAKAAGEEASSGINWATIIFLFGMMVMVEGMAKAGFFRWICLLLAEKAKYKPLALFIIFMIMSAVLSMFIDSITVILFLAAVTIELAKLLNIDPIPMIISEIFCANLGGSATMCGDPPNIIIGTSLGYSFSGFLVNTGLMALVGMVFVVIYYVIIYKKALTAGGNQSIDISKMPKPASAINSKADFVKSCIIFAVAVVLLITHAQTGLTVALIGVMIASITLLAFFKDAKSLLKKVEYEELAFFIGLFIVVGGLEQTGVLELIASFIASICGDNIKLMVAVIIWISAVASSLVDNIPFSATMIPIIKSLSATQGVDISTLAWSLSMGTDIGGSATPIGASANVVGISVAQRNGYYVGWGKYCKSSIPATIIVITISMVIIFIRYC